VGQVSRATSERSAGALRLAADGLTLEAQELAAEVLVVDQPVARENEAEVDPRGLAACFRRGGRPAKCAVAELLQQAAGG
jgi:hypothetical protein